MKIFFVFKNVEKKYFENGIWRNGKILGKNSTSIEQNKLTDNLYETIFMSYYSKHKALAKI